MTRLQSTDGEPKRCETQPGQHFQVIEGKEVLLGAGLTIRRLLPTRGRRIIGGWCFLDHFGPLQFPAGDQGMNVGAHPHIGLQTVTWMVEGEVLHKDSLGYEQLIKPGQLNIMTAGRGISHSEESPGQNSGRLHGVQLWAALPEASRHIEPAFAHHPELPLIDAGGLQTRLFVGSLMGESSPAQVYHPMLGLEIYSAKGGSLTLELNPEFEHALVVVNQSFRYGQTPLTSGNLYDFGRGTSRLTLEAEAGSRAVLVGGAPFEEHILMWWNFVARTREEIQEATRAWNQGERFGEVSAYRGPRLSAPPI